MISSTANRGSARDAGGHASVLTAPRGGLGGEGVRFASSWQVGARGVLPVSGCNRTLEELTLVVWDSGDDRLVWEVLRLVCASESAGRCEHCKLMVAV
jgi:hypothetical protein